MRLLGILLSLITFGGCQPEPAEFRSTMCLDDFYDRSYINNNIARGGAFFGEGLFQFLSYYDVHGDVVVIRRNLQTGNVEKDRIPAGMSTMTSDSSSLRNPHNFISGGLDADGYIHLIFGAHNSKPRHYVSGGPLVLGGWRKIGDWIEREGHRITYPYLVRGPDRGLWLFYRNGRSGYGSTYVVRGMVADAARIRPELLIDGRNGAALNPTTLKYRDRWPGLEIDPRYESSQYLFAPVFSADGCLHLAWTWRLSNFSREQDNPWRKKFFQGVTNRDIAYARTCDKGGSWTDSAGRPYRLPLTRLGDQESSHPEIIDRIDIGTSFFNHYGSDTDSANRPHYVYHHWDRQRRTQIWHLFHDGRRWVKQQVSRYERDLPWNRHQASGLAGTGLARPEILTNPRDDSLLVVTRSEIFGNVLELYRARSPYRHWVMELIDTGSLGSWEPQIDKRLYREQGRLQLLLNTVRDQDAYESFDLRPTPDQQQILEQAGRGQAVDYPDYTILSPVTPYRLTTGGARFPDSNACVTDLLLRE